MTPGTRSQLSGVEAVPYVTAIGPPARSSSATSIRRTASVLVAGAGSEAQSQYSVQSSPDA